MDVTDDWVIDTYGPALTKKLMDHAENDRFLIPPTNAQGALATIKVNDDKVLRVKYIPETFQNETNQEGKRSKSTNVIARKGGKLYWKADKSQ